MGVWGWPWPLPSRLAPWAPARPPWLLLAALGAVAVALGALGALGAVGSSRLGGRGWRGRRSRRCRRQVGAVSELWIYPIKSCKGVAVPEAQCTELGLRAGPLRDRFWLVVKEDGHMVTARQEPRLVLISITCENDHLVLHAPGRKDLSLPTKLPATNTVLDCRVFSSDIQGRDCGPEVAQWISGYLGEDGYRLVQFEPHMLPRRSKDVVAELVTDYQVAYPDCSPINVLSEASLADLNSRLEKRVSVSNFRPSIVVTGCSAFEEDSWDELIIGSVEMSKVMSCPRCILTTVDPDTGIISRKEPLETLKSYRLCDPSERHIYKSSPLFGVYFSVEKIGSLKVGDPVYVLV
ncbi:mitochondrial amidoxime reducing component 2-like [Tachyglossus aculeatus]|uniref:mitochondrial amidoxime reducing component 2-like n=1 Tax=Tachyglossus aculeatus TaxID=9261 RepID=UPI0018F2D6DB|nr:mitochondrial amidoxime reducing component 2-like [Tachyglossus aculeatus]